MLSIDRNSPKETVSHLLDRSSFANHFADLSKLTTAIDSNSSRIGTSKSSQKAF
jgi:hypothetical protein